MSKLLGIKELCEFWQAIKSHLALKQDKLTAGTNITISGNTISATDTNTFKTFYATCPTAASTATKVVTVQGNDPFELKIGTVVGVLFTNSNNAGSPKLNVNNTGAIQIYYNNAVVTTSNVFAGGVANVVNYYMYSGAAWVFMSWSRDNNSWQQNTASQNGYVTSGSGHANQVWKTDGNGVPAWRNDANTWQQNTASQNGYVTAGSGHANLVWKTDGNGVPGWRTDANTTYSNATTSAAGLMSAADKTKLNKLANDTITTRTISVTNVSIPVGGYVDQVVGAIPTVTGYTFVGLMRGYTENWDTTGGVGASAVFLHNIWVDNGNALAGARNLANNAAKVTIRVIALYVKNFS